jgi:hypothetical protein
MVGIWGTLILCALTGTIGGVSFGALLGDSLNSVGWPKGKDQESDKHRWGLGPRQHMKG